MMKISAFVVLAAVVACCFASCDRTTVEVKSSDELTKALKEVQPGWTIHLARGNYSGSFTVSARGDSTCSITIDGFTDDYPGAIFRGGNNNVLAFDDASYIYVKGIQIDSSSSSTYGVLMRGSDNIHLKKCYFYNIHYGVAIDGGKQNTVEDCSFTGITGTSVWIGPNTATSSNTVNYCRFNDELQDTPIVVDAKATSTEISINTISGDRCSYKYGINVIGSDTYVFANNIYYGSSSKALDAGILVSGHKCRLVLNTFQLDGSDDIVVA